MLQKFCIKKHATSTNSPWLVRSLQRDNKGELLYAGIDELIGKCELVTFRSADEARRFIGKTPDMCDEQFVICEIRFKRPGTMEIAPVS